MQILADSSNDYVIQPIIPLIKRKMKRNILKTFYISKVLLSIYYYFSYETMIACNTASNSLLTQHFDNHWQSLWVREHSIHVIVRHLNVITSFERLLLQSSMPDQHGLPYSKMKNLKAAINKAVLKNY